MSLWTVLVTGLLAGEASRPRTPIDLAAAIAELGYRSVPVVPGGS